MRMRQLKPLLLTLLLLLPPLVMAQSKRPFTIEEATPGASAYWQLVPQIPESVAAELPEPLQLINGTIYFKEEVNTPHRALIPMEAEDGEWREKLLSPCGSYQVLLGNYNIGIKRANEKAEQLSSDGSLDIVYGEAAHRNEFGIDRGVFFSPTGRYFAFYRIDQSRVEPYPIVRIKEDNAHYDPIKYPMAGRESQRVTIGIYDTVKRQLTYLQTGTPEDRYFTNLSWDPSEKILYIDEVNRAQNCNELVAYDIETGEALRTLLVECNEKYIEPSTPIYFLPDESGHFVRLSRVDGYTHAYLYDHEGHLLRQLTEGKWEIIEHLGCDPDAQYFYFLSNKDYPIGRDAYRVPLAGGAVERLTQGNGSHSVRISNDYRYMLDTFSNLHTPKSGTLISLGDTPIHQKLYQLQSPLTEIDLPEVRVGVLSSDAGDDLYFKMTLPAYREPNTQYPVILYVYGGPHSQLVTDSWRSLRMGWDSYMAQQGYIVFTLDNRGTSNRGMDFESITHRQLGTIEMQDQMKGIEYLRSLPFVDSERIGVYGWSFGGFMTTNLMLTHPETFKVGVAGGPVMDWSYYEIMYGERYMDTPEENPEGYKANRLTDRVGDLEGRLLLIHGGVDPVVVWLHSQRFLTEAIKAKKLVDYMIYPQDEHNVRGEDRVHLHRTIVRYFEDHL